MANLLHSALSGVNLHDYVAYTGAVDPGAVGAGKLWLDTAAAASPVLKRRNAGDNDWLLVAVPDTLTTKGDLFGHDGTGHVRLGVGGDGALLLGASGQASGLTWGAHPSGKAPDVTASKGDLLARSAAALSRISVGSDGQVLAADAASPVGLAWINPAGGFTDPATIKGDLQARTSGATVRKPVGTASTVLMADASQSDGLAWQGAADHGYPPPLSGTVLDGRRARLGHLAIPGSPFIYVANTLYASPIWLRKGESLSGLAVWCASGAASQAMRLGLYTRTHATGFPDALLWDAGAVVIAAISTLYTAAPGSPYIVPATGWYMAASVSDGTPGMGGLQSGGTTSDRAWLGRASANPSASSPPLSACSRAFTYGALPNPFGGSPAFVTSVSIPNVLVKFS